MKKILFITFIILFSTINTLLANAWNNKITLSSGKMDNITLPNWQWTIARGFLNWKQVFIHNWKQEWGTYKYVNSLTYSKDWTSISFNWMKTNWKYVHIKDSVQIWWEYDWIWSSKYYSNNKSYFRSRIWIKQYIIKDWKNVSNFDNIYAINNISFINNNISFTARDINDDKNVYINNGKKYYNIKIFEQWKIVNLKNIWPRAIWSKEAFFKSKNNNSFAYVITNENWKDIIIKDWIQLWWEYNNITKILFNKKNELYYVVKNIYWKEELYKDWVKISNEYDTIIKWDISWVWILVKDNWLLKFIKDWKETILWNYDTGYYINTWKYVAFVAINNWKYTLIRGNFKTREYDKILNYIISKNWDNIAFNVKVNWNAIVVENWKESKEYWYISHMVYSPDSKNIIFTALDKNEKFIIVVDSFKEIEKFIYFYSHYNYFSPLNWWSSFYNWINSLWLSFYYENNEPYLEINKLEGTNNYIVYIYDDTEKKEVSHIYTPRKINKTVIKTSTSANFQEPTLKKEKTKLNLNNIKNDRVNKYKQVFKVKFKSILNNIPNSRLEPISIKIDNAIIKINNSNFSNSKKDDLFYQLTALKEIINEKILYNNTNNLIDFNNLLK